METSWLVVAVPGTLAVISTALNIRPLLLKNKTDQVAGAGTLLDQKIWKYIGSLESDRIAALERTTKNEQVIDQLRARIRELEDQQQ